MKREQALQSGANLSRLCVGDWSYAPLHSRPATVPEFWAYLCGNEEAGAKLARFIWNCQRDKCTVHTKCSCSLIDCRNLLCHGVNTVNELRVTAWSLKENLMHVLIPVEPNGRVRNSTQRTCLDKRRYLK